MEQGIQGQIKRGKVVAIGGGIKGDIERRTDDGTEGGIEPGT
jgi:preprotein translocase subunit YajC